MAKPVSVQSLIPAGEPPTAWQRVIEHLEKVPLTYWVATVRPEGIPHVMPILAVWQDGGLYFCAGRNTRKAENLALNPHCVVTVERQPFHLVVEGEAGITRDAVALQHVADAYASVYGWRVTMREGAFHDAVGAPTAGPPPYDVYEVAATKAFAFGTDEKFTSTRWLFRRAM